jgi:hypothetical protein
LPLSKRPSLKPLKCFLYTTLFEITTILGLRVIKGYKDKRHKIKSIETLGVYIYILKRFRGGSINLFSLLKTIYNYRF